MRIEPHSKGLFVRVTLPLAVFGLINQAARTVMAVIGPVLAVEFALSASDVAGYDTQGSANILLAYTLTMMAGALVVGAAASRSKAVGLPPMLVTLACTAGYITVGRSVHAPGHRRLGARFWPRTVSGGWDPRGYSAALAVSLALQLFVALRLLGGNA